MDYELKYVIAICLIVKIAALSPEFSINEETEKLEQIPTRVEQSLSPSSAAAENTLATFSGEYNHRMLFNWTPGREKFNRMNNKKDVAKAQRIIENQSFDTCEHKLKLLEGSLKWRDIRKTLHWLGRILASNKTNTLCPTRKGSRQGASIYGDVTKTKFKNKNIFKKKETTWPKNFRNNSVHKKSTNFKKEHKKKYWINHSRKGKNKSKRKEFQGDITNLPPLLNATILKPNSVLFDFEKMFFKRTKIKGENFQSQKCNDSYNLGKNCERSREYERESKNHTGKWSPEVKSREQDRENEAKLPKPKPWPHFVYHRVSSNFLHPELTGQNHGKSAYIAISVVNGGKSDSTDNNNV